MLIHNINLPSPHILIVLRRLETPIVVDLMMNRYFRFSYITSSHHAPIHIYLWYKNFWSIHFPYKNKIPQYLNNITILISLCLFIILTPCLLLRSVPQSWKVAWETYKQFHRWKFWTFCTTNLYKRYNIGILNIIFHNHTNPDFDQWKNRVTTLTKLIISYVGCCMLVVANIYCVYWPLVNAMQFIGIYLSLTPTSSMQLYCVDWPLVNAMQFIGI
jgi:hypothetical protein